VGVFGEAAGRLAAAAARIQDGLAMDVCEAQALAFQQLERELTPKKTGALADSETIDSLSGGGSHAEATVAPHKIYAEFRNDGGTIHAKEGPARSGRLHQPSGIPYRHSLAWAGGFAMHVTQAGAHYVQRAQAAAPGICRQAAEAVMDADLGDIF
jgi:hypothetical protein